MGESKPASWKYVLIMGEICSILFGLLICFIGVKHTNPDNDGRFPGYLLIGGGIILLILGIILPEKYQIKVDLQKRE